MPVKTNTLLNAETQANLETPVRIEQLKLGVDWHADHFRLVRMRDGLSPQPVMGNIPYDPPRYLSHLVTNIAFLVKVACEKQ